MQEATEPEIPPSIREIGLDEMGHFVEEKVKTSGSSKRWIVAAGELLPRLQGSVMLQPSSDSRTK